MDANTNIVGVFDDYSTAEQAARELQNAGIPREYITVKSNHMTGAAGRSTESSDEGGISGFFHRLFGAGDNEYRDHYSEALRRGSALVCVTATEDQVDRVSSLLNQYGAVDIDERVQAYQEEGYERYNPDAPVYTHDEATRERERFRGDERQSLPVVEEELQVGKRNVQRGGVRVHSHVVDRPVEEQVTLREEHAKVERRKVDREIDPSEIREMRDQSIEVTEMAEVPVVQKRARVREEVVIGKETTERTENVRDSVRHTEVDVQQMEGTRSTTDYRQDFRRDYDSNYAGSGVAYDSVAPAYDYGYQMANEQRYRGRSWSDVESDIRTDYMRKNPNSTWENVKGAVRYGWEKVSGQR